jgi:hypothetical protein
MLGSITSAAGLRQVYPSLHFSGRTAHPRRILPKPIDGFQRQPLDRVHFSGARPASAVSFRAPQASDEPKLRAVIQNILTGPPIHYQLKPHSEQPDEAVIVPGYLDKPEQPAEKQYPELCYPLSKTPGLDRLPKQGAYAQVIEQGGQAKGCGVIITPVFKRVYFYAAA